MVSSHFLAPELIVRWSLRFLSTKILDLGVKELTHAAKVEETPATENGNILLATNDWSIFFGCPSTKSCIFASRMRHKLSISHIVMIKHTLPPKFSINVRMLLGVL